MYQHKFKFSQVPIGQKLTFFALLIVALLVENLFLYNVHINKRESIKKASFFKGSAIAKEIEYIVGEYENSAQILKNFYLQYGDDFVKEDFDNVCKTLVEDNIAIGNLAVAPNSIIQAVYPKTEETEKIIGRSIIGKDRISEYASISLISKSPVIVGPVALSQNDENQKTGSLIIYNPMYKGTSFLGFSVILIDTKTFIEQIIERVGDGTEGYYFGVYKDNNWGILTDKEGFIYKNNAAIEDNIELSKDVVVNVHVPNDVWRICIQPVAGWKAYQDMIAEIVVSFLLLILFVVVSFLKIHSDTVKMYEYQHDSLTGLYTRSALYRRLKVLFETESDTSFDMILADINHFKVVNRVYGTEKCDELLKFVGLKLRQLSYNNLCCRFSGDQYLFIVKNDQNITEEFLSEYVKEIISEAPINHFLLKFGLYRNIDKTETIGLISDKALIAVKSIRNNFDINIGNFDGPVSKQILRTQIIESKFFDALHNGEFKIWFQPKFSSKTEKLVGAEALVRWWDPNSATLYSPNMFVSIFEDDGLIYHLDRFIFNEVCKLIKTWIDNGERVIPISVNVSRTTMIRPGVVEEYYNDAQKIGVPLKYVPLEITESTTYNTTKIAELGQKFQEYGFLLNMDDFGTGSSSLASLNLMKFDAIKIDKSLVDFIGNDDGDELLRHAVELAHFKKLDVVAEGVENRDQLEFLKTLDCDIIQGYYFSKPRSFEDFVEFKKECDKNL